jgi:dipeptidyl aminopeptidase/acylaminoacyl peptidase
LALLCLGAALAACERPTPATPPAPTATARPTSPPTAAPVLTATPIPSLTPTPDPFTPYYVESLRARSYGQGPIEIVQELARTGAFTRYLITYPSDGLRITGMMNVPRGDGPFPVIVLNHGYYDPARYHTGDGTRNAADVFARRGYLTLAPDYRDYGGSDVGHDMFRTGLAVDVLNLMASIGSLPQARADDVGVWGHSMGGGISIEVMVVNPPGLRGVALYGAMNGDMGLNYERILENRGGAALGPDWPVAPADAPEIYARLSPSTYLNYVSVPVLIHHGLLDQTVPPAWSQQLAQELQAAGKDVTFFTYPSAGHSFYDANWTLFMAHNLQFFDRLLMGR